VRFNYKSLMKNRFYFKILTNKNDKKLNFGSRSNIVRYMPV